MNADDVSREEYAYINRRRNPQYPANTTRPKDLVGIALSGGGIRSATFALGVLEALARKGLLKKADYLSTVSGGGYIGAWLSANCRRAADINEDWLDGKENRWADSIGHLRRYSNYLAPRLGFFSADTWSMLLIWARNASLVQMTVVLAIAALLLLVLPLQAFFMWWPHAGPWRWTGVVIFLLAVMGIAGNQKGLSSQQDSTSHGPARKYIQNPWVLGLLAVGVVALTLFGIEHWHHDPFDNQPDRGWAAWLVPVAITLASFMLLSAVLNFKKYAASQASKANVPVKAASGYTQGQVQRFVVLPLMVVSFMVGAVLWKLANEQSALGQWKSFGELFLFAAKYWTLPLSLAFSSLWLLAFNSRDKLCNGLSRLVAFLAPVPCVLVLHGLLCAIVMFLQQVHGNPENPDGGWIAFIAAPALALVAFSLTILMLIGMMGRQSSESVREWWSRLGAWLCIYGFAWMLMAVVATYGAVFVGWLIERAEWVKWPALGGWLLTTIAGLFTGHADASGKTNRSQEAEDGTLQKLLNVLTVVVPFVFIAGLLVAVATGLQVVLSALVGGNWMALPKSWSKLSAEELGNALLLMAGVFVLLTLFANRIDINEFSLNAFYRNRLARCYLGATRQKGDERHPQAFTGFDQNDDMPLCSLCPKDGSGAPTDDPAYPAGPLHLINCALNLGGSSDLALHTRHSASFTLSPIAVGTTYAKAKQDRFCGTSQYGGDLKHPTLAQAISVSGAAASPNMGYHTSSAVAFLLTMFNARLGWWFPDPGKKIPRPTPRFNLYCLARELFGLATDSYSYLMISDGGHFENLGVYELVRRRCSVIVVSDAECDPELHFEALGTLIRMCEVDFNARIDIDVNALRVTAGAAWSPRRFATGDIVYDDGTVGTLIYFKASMTGHEDTSILQYRSGHADFPHESTGNQFYGEDQFESYRRLGREIVVGALDGVPLNADWRSAADQVVLNGKKNP